jgi:glycosyltransferase involved in cell wall biosynthesis
MKEARFLVFPSEWYEGFPMVIAEAFACGLPVVAARIGSAAEIVSDGRTGCLFAPGTPADLVAKAAWAWDHPQECAAMGREARLEYEARYTPLANYARLLEIYHSVIAGDAGGG